MFKNKTRAWAQERAGGVRYRNYSNGRQVHIPLLVCSAGNTVSPVVLSHFSHSLNTRSALQLLTGVNASAAGAQTE